jgi:hypothetical protein
MLVYIYNPGMRGVQAGGVPCQLEILSQKKKKKNNKTPKLKKKNPQYIRPPLMEPSLAL